MHQELKTEVQRQVDQAMRSHKGAITALCDIVHAQDRLIQLANEKIESVTAELDALSKVIAAVAQFAETEVAGRKNWLN